MASWGWGAVNVSGRSLTRKGRAGRTRSPRCRSTGRGREAGQAVWTGSCRRAGEARGRAVRPGPGWGQSLTRGMDTESERRTAPRGCAPPAAESLMRAARGCRPSLVPARAAPSVPAPDTRWGPGARSKCPLSLRPRPPAPGSSVPAQWPRGAGPIHRYRPRALGGGAPCTSPSSPCGLRRLPDPHPADGGPAATPCAAPAAAHTCSAPRALLGQACTPGAWPSHLLTPPTQSGGPRA